MTEHTKTSFHDLVIRTFATVEAKELEAMMSLFADSSCLPSLIDRRHSGTFSGLQ
jgi:hypothetical protein